MTPEARAWILDVGHGHYAAAAPQHAVEYLLAPVVHPAPQLRPHVYGIAEWRGYLVPLLDLAALLDDCPAEPEERLRVMILAYRAHANAEIRFGGLVVRSEPKEIPVRDDMACGLPPEPTAWSEVALSCFSYEEQPVPILNVAALFPETRAAAEPASLAVESTILPDPQSLPDNRLHEAAGP